MSVTVIKVKSRGGQGIWSLSVRASICGVSFYPWPLPTSSSCLSVFCFLHHSIFTVAIVRLRWVDGVQVRLCVYSQKFLSDAVNQLPSSCLTEQRSISDWGTAPPITQKTNTHNTGTRWRNSRQTCHTIITIQTGTMIWLAEISCMSYTFTGARANRSETDSS